MVCPWDAGGTSDGLCRIVSEIGARDEYFGVNMVVQNSGGAGGTVATTEFKNAAPDGYTLCQEAIGVFTLQPSSARSVTQLTTLSLWRPCPMSPSL